MSEAGARTSGEAVGALEKAIWICGGFWSVGSSVRFVGKHYQVKLNISEYPIIPLLVTEVAARIAVLRGSKIESPPVKQPSQIARRLCVFQLV